MIILITGATHTGKTLLAQKLLDKYRWPYLSMDHVKMGLIRSGNTALTPYDDEQMTGYLWPIVREIIKTAVENSQNLIVEGCYVPAEWERDFAQEYREKIRFICLAMTERYIRSRFDEIVAHASAIERRCEDGDFTLAVALEDNARVLAAFGGSPGLVMIDRSFEETIGRVINDE